MKAENLEQEDSDESVREMKQTKYKDYKREIGSGPLRIGNSIQLDEDIYSLFFVSTMHPDYIYYYDKILDTEHEKFFENVKDILAKSQQPSDRQQDDSLA